jgi:Protein of unknown function (DUF4038)/Putative collagen-binding domain of a collagenase/FG-GAP-like repeat
MKALTKFRITCAPFCLVLLCAVAIPAHAATTTITTPNPNFPLKLSANGHYLTTQDGTPFFIAGDTPWNIINQGTNSDIDTYLADRASRGFTALVVELVDNTYSTRSPNNIDGVVPYTVPGNFSTYNPAYYDRFEYLVDRADSYGIVIFMWPLYLGFNCGVDGLGQLVAADTTAHLQSFATYIGNRFKNKGNIVWVMSGDTDPFACGLNAKVDAFATALKAADPNHLITEHNARNSEGVTPWLPGGVPSWYTLNSTYTDNFTYSLSQTAYNRSPTRPFVLLEARYENAGVTRSELRAEAYWSILSGNCGYMFGNCPLWGLGSTQVHNLCIGTPTDWHTQLSSPGSQDMTRFKNLFTSVAWQALVPDFTHTTVTAGFGTGATTVTTGRASDGSFVMSYLPVITGITVDMTRLAPSSVSARWYDPSNGAFNSIGTFPNTGTRVFTPTGNNSSGASDWVLVLQSSTPSPSPTPTPTPTPTATPIATPTSTPTPNGWNLITTGDFNRNGRPDYVLQNVSTQETAIWYLNNNVYVSGAYGPTLPSGWQLVEKTRDFNGDGKPDYVLYATSRRQSAIWYLDNNVYLGGAYGPTLPAGWMLTTTGDFNGDGRPDYVLYNASTRQSAIWYLNNNFYVGGAYGPTIARGWNVVGIADFNRDGHPDYLLFHPSSGYTAIWYLSGTTLIGGAWGPIIPSGWALVATGDFNTDGKPDYVLYNGVTGQTGIWYLNNNVYVNSAYGPTLP